MGGATQVINLAAGFLIPAFRANRVHSLRDLGRLISALGAMFYLASSSAAAVLRENCIDRIGPFHSLVTKEDLATI